MLEHEIDNVNADRCCGAVVFTSELWVRPRPQCAGLYRNVSEYRLDTSRHNCARSRHRRDTSARFNNSTLDDLAPFIAGLLAV
jgi:hypothetical protein